MRVFKFFNNLNLGIKLNLVSVVVLVLVVVAIVLVNVGLSNLVNQTGQLRIEDEVSLIQSGFAAEEELALFRTKSVATAPGLAEAVANRDTVAIQTITLTAGAPFGLADIDVVDTNGNRLLTLTAEGVSSEVGEEDALLSLALLGIDTTGIVSEEGGELLLAGTAPIRDTSGAIVGAIIASVEMDDEFLEAINFSREDVRLGIVREGRIVAQFSGQEQDAATATAADVSALAGIELDQAVIQQALNGETVISSALERSPDGNPNAVAYLPLSLGSFGTGNVLVIQVDLGRISIFQRQLSITLTVALALALLLGIGLAFLIARLVTRQVTEMDNLFRAVAVGEFDRRAEVFSKDELGQTAEGINAVLDLLTDQLTQAQQQRADLEHAIANLVEEVGALAAGDLSLEANVADETTGPIAEALNFAVGQLRGLVSGVTSASSEMTGASDAIGEVVQLLTTQAANSAQVAAQAAASAQQGGQAVTDTIAAMDRIRDNTQETARRIKRLGEASQEISEVVRLIEDVADRTTVLALNASIQAAAAGEAGRGFAVVAEEVQRLADRATGETRRIEDIVKTIQAETNEAVVGIDAATQEVVDGSQLAQDAGERMTELGALVEELSGLIQNVADTTTQQTGQSVAALSDLSVNLQESVAVFAAPDGDRVAVRDGRGGNGDGTYNE